jgi:hypothetical protein
MFSPKDHDRTEAVMGSLSDNAAGAGPLVVLSRLGRGADDPGPYSVVAALEPGRTSWTAVLDAVRSA